MGVALKIYFNLAGKKHGGKSFKPVKKSLPEFDPSQCEYTPKHVREEMRARHRSPGYRETAQSHHGRMASSHGHSDSSGTESATEEGTEEVSQAIKRPLRRKRQASQSLKNRSMARTCR